MPKIEPSSKGGCENSIPLDETRKILVDGKQVGINEIDEIFSQVRPLGLRDDDAIADELISRVKQSDFVPAGKERAYRAALLDEFKKG
jgi:hypothetical protein